MAITLNGTTGIITPAETVNGNETVTGNLSVGGNETVTGNLTVTGTITATGAITANGGVSGAAGLGVDQTWQSVTRTSGTTYTNSTGKPIIFQCSCTGNGQYLEILVSGVRVAYVVNNGTFTFASAVIPAGATYVVNYNANIQYPVELR
jgi:hypothetical protein